MSSLYTLVDLAVTYLDLSEIGQRTLIVDWYYVILTNISGAIRHVGIVVKLRAKIYLKFDLIYLKTVKNLVFKAVLQNNVLPALMIFLQIVLLTNLPL